jgi:hypothetical protein
VWVTTSVDVLPVEALMCAVVYDVQHPLAVRRGWQDESRVCRDKALKVVSLASRRINTVAVGPYIFAIVLTSVSAFGMDSSSSRSSSLAEAGLPSAI